MFRYIYYLVRATDEKLNKSQTRIKVTILAENTQQAERRLNKAINGLEYEKTILARVEQQG